MYFHWEGMKSHSLQKTCICSNTNYKKLPLSSQYLSTVLCVSSTKLINLTLNYVYFDCSFQHTVWLNADKHFRGTYCLHLQDRSDLHISCSCLTTNITHIRLEVLTAVKIKIWFPSWRWRPYSSLKLKEWWKRTTFNDMTFTAKKMKA
jgi:hypothetical protein